jgi:hypothetical protein
MDGWINKLQQIIDRLKSGGQSAGVTQTPVNPVVHTHNDTNTQNTSTGTSSPTQPNTGHQDNYTKPAELPVNGKLDTPLVLGVNSAARQSTFSTLSVYGVNSD